jgi:hypothetical protein
MNENTTLLSPALKAIAWGLSVLAFGWTVMGVFWLNSGYTGERGFLFFESGFLGDLVFLPILAGSLYAAVGYAKLIQKNGKPTIIEERASWVVALICTVICSLIPMFWLSSDKTELNWTIPALHTFNTAGWWHAIFFFLLFPALIGYLTVRMFIFEHKSRACSEYPHARLFSLTLVWMGASGYIFVRLYETMRWSFGDWRMLLLTTGLVVLFWIILCIVHRRFPDLDALKTSLAGCFGAYGVACLFIQLIYKAPPDGSFTVWGILLPLSIAIFSTRIVSLLSNKIQQTRYDECVVFLAVYGLTNAIVKSDGILSAGMAIGITMLSMLLIIQKAPGAEGATEHFLKLPKTFQVQVLITVILSQLLALTKTAAASSLIRPQQLGDSQDLLLPLVIAFCVGSIHGLFLTHARNPESRASQINFDAIAIGKEFAYRRIMLTTIGMILFTVPFIVDQTLDLSNTSSWGLWLFIPLCTAILMYLYCKKPILRLVLLSISYLIVAAMIFGLREPVYPSPFDLFLIFPVLGSACFIYNGIIRNGYSLLDRTYGVAPDYNSRHKVVGLIVFVGCLIVFSVSILPSKLSDGVSFSIVSPLIGLAGLAISSCALPRLGAMVFGCPESGGIIGDAAMRGIRQDTRNAFFIIAAAGLLAIHIYEWLFTANGWIGIITFMGLIIAGCSVLVKFTLEANKEHYDKVTSQEVGTNNEQEKVLRLRIYDALRVHLEKQAKITFVALLPYSLFFLCVPLMFHRECLAPDSEKTYTEVLYQEYMLRFRRLR